MRTPTAASARQCVTTKWAPSASNCIRNTCSAFNTKCAVSSSRSNALPTPLLDVRYPPNDSNARDPFNCVVNVHAARHNAAPLLSVRDFNTAKNSSVVIKSNNPTSTSFTPPPRTDTGANKGVIFNGDLAGVPNRFDAVFTNTRNDDADAAGVPDTVDSPVGIADDRILSTDFRARDRKNVGPPASKKQKIAETDDSKNPDGESCKRETNKRLLEVSDDYYDTIHTQQKQTMMWRVLLALMVVAVATVSAFRSPVSTPRMRKTELSMGGKMSKFGIFSPAVYAAKAVLGEAKLNKLRGKAISLHSQAITEWCQQYGAYNLRLKLVRSSFAVCLRVSLSRTLSSS